MPLACHAYNLNIPWHYTVTIIATTVTIIATIVKYIILFLNNKIYLRG